MRTKVNRDAKASGAGKAAAFDQTRIARPDWVEFCVKNHGRGAHRDRTVYNRKLKHKHKKEEKDSDG
jgi:hypothetical protein